MTIYREPMLTTAEVASRLGLTIRQAQTLVGRHPEASRVHVLLLPERCLPDLVKRPGRGRPRAS